ncbi:rhodanese-like domain-containing protein [Rhodoferax antarcticus]|uniref:Thiosulfate sulfurtransferase n=1 Tax=Rhodoferax antarcticus ANT.BR TaxID=1111071 RepID=A0A1Q8YA03_9BURK|nr:rhodanese-like domain-containing protein [Rhodoferax antarcticus]APW46987.1 sulfurtransferase [Rhodoferax antarcticus]OLP04842.1 thiosulfate sulfurtransferase [Rhodoferax antarcticus ANT.BR]
MIAQIRPSQLAAWLESVKEFGSPAVLDVREPCELQMASIKAEGFELITIPMGVIPARLHELNPSQPLACLCHHGARSMQVAYFLKARGFNHLANIAGGINAWSAEVDPTVPRY